LRTARIGLPARLPDVKLDDFEDRAEHRQQVLFGQRTVFFLVGGNLPFRQEVRLDSIIRCKRSAPEPSYTGRNVLNLKEISCWRDLHTWPKVERINGTRESSEERLLRITSACETEKQDSHNLLKIEIFGGREGIGPPDPLLAKQDQIQSKSFVCAY